MTSKRLYALDNLRGIMMWLGIVFHVSLLHMSSNQRPLFWYDPQTSATADLLVGFIHCFRMPVFFILSGFFVAMLLHEKGLAGMLQNRFKRIALPFAVFWLLLAPLTLVSILLYLHIAHDGQWGIDLGLLPKGTESNSVDTIHLWFLWMLIWFYLLTACVVKILPRMAWLQAKWWGTLLRWWVVHPLAPLLLAIPLTFTDASSPMGILETNTSFFPPLNQWIHYGIFYLWGIALYIHYPTALQLLANRYRSYFVASLIAFCLYLGLAIAQIQAPESGSYATVWLAALYNLSAWLMCLTWIGCFVGYFNCQTPVLSYLAQSSYWVYLIHFPVTIVMGAAYYRWTAAAEIKIAVNVLATTLLCLFSYRFMVRNTFISIFLNGKKYAD